MTRGRRGGRGRHQKKNEEAKVDVGEEKKTQEVKEVKLTETEKYNRLLESLDELCISILKEPTLQKMEKLREMLNFSKFIESSEGFEEKAKKILPFIEKFSRSLDKSSLRRVFDRGFFLTNGELSFLEGKGEQEEAVLKKCTKPVPDQKVLSFHYYGFGVNFTENEAFVVTMTEKDLSDAISFFDKRMILYFDLVERCKSFLCEKNQVREDFSKSCFSLLTYEILIDEQPYHFDEKKFLTKLVSLFRNC